jgi:hypothetical protein
LRSAEKARARLGRGARIAFALLHMFATELQRTLARTFAYCSAVAALGLILAELVSSRGASLRTAAPNWVEVIRPLPAFAMTIPEFEAPRYAIWRRAGGIARKDVLSFGEAGGATATIEIVRGEFDDGDITASVSELRLSGPRVSPNGIDTKFGVIHVESAIEDGRNCLHFSHKYEELRFEISGMFCSAGMELVDHGTVACAIDRLSLIAAGSEPRLAALFARAELRRDFCGQRSVFVAATPKLVTDWIEAARDPKLRRASVE